MGPGIGTVLREEAGAWLAVIQVPVARIPNVFVLTGLLRQLGCRGAQGRPPSATSGG